METIIIIALIVVILVLGFFLFREIAEKETREKELEEINEELNNAFWQYIELIDKLEIKTNTVKIQEEQIKLLQELIKSNTNERERISR
jgi:CBS domain containing-hemolysin-like protein